MFLTVLVTMGVLIIRVTVFSMACLPHWSISCLRQGLVNPGVHSCDCLVPGIRLGDSYEELNKMEKTCSEQLYYSI
jgi:hypothetical protein